MSDHVFNVLFLCTGNSARSIMGEAVLNKREQGRFRAFSAGSHPKGSVHPLALKVLREARVPGRGNALEELERIRQSGAPEMDFVVTVCDNAAGETCPFWPGQPMTAHWGIEDPAAVEGTEIEKERAFVTALRYLRNRIAAFTALPVKSLDEVSLQSQLREIGQSEGSPSPRQGVA